MIEKPGSTMLSVRIGNWFEAHATGWGVVVAPILLVLMLLAAGLGWLGP